MARTRILLDSNVYFRLARSMHPLLDEEFGGGERYCLHVISELADEYDRSPRLRRKFEWVHDSEYRDNRSRPLKISRSEKKEAGLSVGYLLSHARQMGLGVSKVDVQALAIAQVLGIQIVTDDQDMLSLASEFQIDKLNSLELLQLMLKSDHITRDKVREIAAYWQYGSDIPANFRNDYIRLFGEDPPHPT